MRSPDRTTADAVSVGAPAAHCQGDGTFDRAANGWAGGVESHSQSVWHEGCWGTPGDPARDAIAASDGLDGRDRQGSGGIDGWACCARASAAPVRDSVTA